MSLDLAQRILDLSKEGADLRERALAVSKELQRNMEPMPSNTIALCCLGEAIDALGLAVTSFIKSSVFLGVIGGEPREQSN